MLEQLVSLAGMEGRRSSRVGRDFSIDTILGGGQEQGLEEDQGYVLEGVEEEQEQDNEMVSEHGMEDRYVTEHWVKEERIVQVL